MALVEGDLLHGLGRAWVEECESATRAGVWERTGSGAPVLLIMGLGLSGGGWWRTVPVLAGRLEVITFDNRGVGRSRALFHAPDDPD